MADTDIAVQLKAKHYYLVAEILFNTAANVSYRTIKSIGDACQGAADDDLITLLIAPETVFYVYEILTFKPEGQFNRINSEMFDLLMPQIQAGVTGGNVQWIWLGTNIQSMRDINLAVADNMIADGKSKLYS
jgi:hypothetical protein